MTGYQNADHVQVFRQGQGDVSTSRTVDGDSLKVSFIGGNWDVDGNVFTAFENFLFEGDEIYYSSDSSVGVASGLVASPVVNSLRARAHANDLTWQDRANNEIGYQVFRQVGSGGWTLLETLSEDAFTFTDTHVLPGFMYGYKVRALAGPGTAWSEDSYSVAIQGSTWAYDLIASGFSEEVDGHDVYTLSLWASDETTANQETININWGDGTGEVLHGLPAGALVHTYANAVHGMPSVVLSRPYQVNAGETYDAEGGTGVLYTSNVNIAAGGVLDLKQQDMVIQCAPGTAAAVYAQVVGWLALGHTGTGGIMSSTAAGGVDYALGAIVNDDGNGGTYFSMFHGIAVDENSILIKYTVRGDATLDGTVNVFDVNVLAGHWQQQAGATWQQGDFNFDGQVDISDLLTMAVHWQWSM